jgi:hypothetical protein
MCIPSAIPAAERCNHASLISELFSKRALELTELSDGYAVRFSQDDFEPVARFISAERLCCPFLTFEIRLEPGAGSLWLRMLGPKGAREVLQAELSLTKRCGCQS